MLSAVSFWDMSPRRVGASTAAFMMRRKMATADFRSLLSLTKNKDECLVRHG